MSEQNNTRVRRRRRSRAEIEETMREFATSGLGQSEFCRKHEFPISTLGRYLPLTALGRQRPPAAPARATPALVEVEVKPAAGTKQGGSRANLTVWLCNGQ